jgi:anhydro-N-acetylmuramic acid kinase
MKTYKILGLMSGTSLDGLDLVYCHIRSSGEAWDFKIITAKTIGYEPQMRKQLKDSIFLNGEELLRLHNEYGTWLGEQALAFVETEALDVDFISSHGHTSHHQPQIALTFQLGSGRHLATASGLTTICDFRTQDVALGGQGAPLVPIGDHLFFGEYDFCLNLGGISNISFEQNGSRVAYDIGLANMVLNHICTGIGKSYDEDGQMARGGKLLPGLYRQLNELEYYQLPIPKSTGFEWFLREVVPLIDSENASPQDLLHTSVHHICEQIALQLRKFDSDRQQTLLVTGGGAIHGCLVETLPDRLGPGRIAGIPETWLLTYKEALVFALMGALRKQLKINVLRSVTGARKDSSSGEIFLP